eukprot:scaffold3034_cov110-Skeletonema_dohrnii-CCMP3373.AAC.16
MSDSRCQASQMQRHQKGLSRERRPTRGRRSSSSSERPSRLASQQMHPDSSIPKSKANVMHRSRSCGSGKPTQKPSRSSRRGQFNIEVASAPDYYIESFRRLSTTNRYDGNNVHESGANKIRSRQQPHIGTGGGGPESSSLQRRYEQYYSNPNPLPLPSSSSSRSSQHAVKSSQLPRRNAYSKGIDVRHVLPPPPRQKAHEARVPKAFTVDTASTTTHALAPHVAGECSLQTESSMAVASSRRNSNIPERSMEDAATSCRRLRELCMEIIQSNKEGRPSPQRSVAGECSLQTVSSMAVASSRSNSNIPERKSMEDAATSCRRLRELCMEIIQSNKEEIKEVVAAYHRSRHQALSPRDPNFVEIPSEYAEVLTYGLARSQSVPNSTIAATTQTGMRAPAAALRSKFSEIKDDGDEVSPMHSTIVLSHNEDEVSCISFHDNGRESKN